MSKLRSISNEIRLSQSFSKLTLRQRDLWHGLIATADDQGRLPGLSAAIRSLVWPYDDIVLSEVDKDLEALQSIENILIYELDGQKYIQIINWWKYQKMQWAGTSKYPAPNGWLDRERYHGKGRKIYTKNWDTPGGFFINIEDVNVNVNDNDNVKVKPIEQSHTTKVDDKGSQDNIFRLFEQVIGPVSQILVDELGMYEDEFDSEWIAEAFKLAAERNARNWSYVKKVLDNWKTHGRDWKPQNQYKSRDKADQRPLPKGL